jgi:hypothetical protein
MVNPGGLEPPTHRGQSIRRWQVPPGIAGEPGEVLPGISILDEFKDQRGLVLWQVYNDALLWADTPFSSRSGLFQVASVTTRETWLAGITRDGALEVALPALAELLSAPTEVDATTVRSMCLEVSRWAEQRKAMSTATAFAIVAAKAMPTSAAAALRVGHLAVVRNTRAPAEAWLRRTVAVARRSREWSAYAEAYLELAALAERRGVAELAMRMAKLAHSAAVRWSVSLVRAAALRTMSRLALSMGDDVAAEQFLVRARRAYSRSHAEAAGALSEDFAVIWIYKGEYDRAASLLTRILPHRTDAVARTLTLALLARASAGIGDRMLYTQASTQAWKIISGLQPERFLSSLLAMCSAAEAISDEPLLRTIAPVLASAAGGVGDVRAANEARRVLEAIGFDRQ